MISLLLWFVFQIKINFITRIVRDLKIMKTIRTGTLSNYEQSYRSSYDVKVNAVDHQLFNTGV